MTVTTAPRTADYRGDGATVTFPVPFRFLALAHLRVVLIDSQGVETAGVVASVAGVGAAAGGTVTLATAPATGVRVLVFGQTPLSQEVDFTPGGAMPGDVVERAFDKLAMGQQEQAEKLSRAVVIPRAAGVKDVAFPVPVANKGLTFDSAGQLVTTRGDFDQLVGRAESSATAAGVSERAAQGSATQAQASETKAGTSAGRAGLSRAAAAKSATAAAVSATGAKASATSAAKSAAQAKASETAAQSSATKAKTSETNASTSRAAAAGRARAAAQSATAAQSSETKAAASATGAKASETTAQKSAKDAKESATQSTDSMRSATWYEAMATTSASDAAKSATAAGASATGAKASATQAATAASTATTQATGAAQSATAAAASATKAGASETKAKASQTAAKTSETAAKTSATNAAASATTATGAAARVSGRFATQAQAEAGTDNNHLMTPRLTAAAIAKQGWRPTNKGKEFRPTASDATLRVDVTGLDYVGITPRRDLTLTLVGGVTGQRVSILNRLVLYTGGGFPEMGNITVITPPNAFGGTPDKSGGSNNYPSGRHMIHADQLSTFANYGGDWVLVGQSDPGLPVGAIIQWPNGTPPHGFLYCNGARIVTNRYRELSRILRPSGLIGSWDWYARLPDLRSKGHFIIRY